MKLNVSYYKEMDSLIEILYKIAQRSAITVEILNKQPAFINFIERWQKENPHFPLSQSKTRIFKQGVAQLNTKQFPINQESKISPFLKPIGVNKVGQYTKDRLQRLAYLV